MTPKLATVSNHLQIMKTNEKNDANNICFLFGRDKNHGTSLPVSLLRRAEREH